MARSLKKGPFVDQKLIRKVENNIDSGKKAVIKTWSRRSVIIPEFVGQTFAVHNGNKFIQFLYQKTWLGINLVSFLQLELSECILGIENKLWNPSNT